MKKFFTIKTIAGLGVLTAILVCLYFLSTVVRIGTLTLNLTLIPIAVGACLFGPFGGLFLGLVDGALNLTAPETGAFLTMNAWATVLMVLIKTGAAGFIAGLIFQPFKNKHPFIGCVLASISVPLLNTGIFLAGFLLFFSDMVAAAATEAGKSIFEYTVILFIGLNFLIEFLVNAILSTVVHTVYTTFERRLGD